uniref:C3H1-type domain-containing protein n=1 Tax=Kalanchoe fedtschenkoi TaxID=63787 RepID=A0A7N0UCV3_KALFE
MQPSKQLCRYYQRGSCQYGARCKFAHEIEQPSKPNNSFGFGVQQNPGSVQQQNNPFGFGVQSGLNSQSQHSRSAQQQPNPFGFGVKGNNPSSKPFDNKWSRVSANPGTGAAASSRKGDGQSPAATHSCTDPDSCKKQIAEDFEHERPLWKLTCYSHHKYAPCDITGDVSYEELRMSAYDDAKSGMSLPAIVSVDTTSFKYFT